MDRLFPLACVLLIAAAGCGRRLAPQAPIASGEAAEAIALGAPPGEPVSAAAAVRNPFEGDRQAAAQGKQLFSQMNCVYCHGSAAIGLIGPPLDGHGWRYGGSPAALYASIHDGRPQGMPAWRGRLPPDQIWRLVSYLETLGGAAPPATAAMARLMAPAPSATGPQVAGESAADSAAADQKASNAEPAR